jgi:hypothetical protein
VSFTHIGFLTDPENIDISTADHPTHCPPDPTLEPMTDEFDLFQGDFISYTQRMSQMSIDPGDGTSSIQYDDPRVSSYDTHSPSTWVPEMEASTDIRHEHHCREIRSRDTYNPSLIRRMFHRRWCIFFQRLFFIYELYFLHLWFKI